MEIELDEMTGAEKLMVAMLFVTFAIGVLALACGLTLVLIAVAQWAIFN